jgi:hypothetical protein
MGVSEYDQVLNKLNIGGAGGQIFESSNIVAGTGMVSPVASSSNIRLNCGLKSRRRPAQ